ncbi:hypothetical protein TcasGA2_TC015999 [Tribolium castaneum]|uniref:Uncharacterized protein n=1 Tax=Tribolium castaneum TaxID=7070 RepID=D7EM18_TRICA|nr:hypothetical protein TcasGA2_TC015999 [Tribolium castaneum]
MIPAIANAAAFSQNDASFAFKRSSALFIANYFRWRMIYRVLYKPNLTYFYHYAQVQFILVIYKAGKSIDTSIKYRYLTKYRVSIPTKIRYRSIVTFDIYQGIGGIDTQHLDTFRYFDTMILAIPQYLLYLDTTILVIPR